MMRLIPPLFRRKSSAKSTASSATTNSFDEGRNRSKSSLLILKKRGKSPGPIYEDEAERLPVATPPTSESLFVHPQHIPTPSPEEIPSLPQQKANPRVTLEEPTPLPLSCSAGPVENLSKTKEDTQVPIRPEAEALVSQRPGEGTQQQSLASSNEPRLIKTLLEPERPQARSAQSDYFGEPSANMLHRKIWVKRPNASATLVVINEDDLVDDVRDMILKKYANSLGRSFDAPDVTLRIVPRDHSHRHPHGERVLGPEESIARTLDIYYPGGQTVNDALVIDVPQRRTPRQSPKVLMPYYPGEDIRPGESGTDYFPQMPLGGAPSPHLPSNLSVVSGQSGSHRPSAHSISILNTGQVPALPSPGGLSSRQSHRPRMGRTHTSSPTMANSVPGNQSDRSLIHSTDVPPPPPLPTPPIPIDAASRTATPPPRVSSPRPTKAGNKRHSKAKLPSNTSASQSPLEGGVPPISVLIVEDNIINLKLLVAMMQRLQVRWQTAMNGREAVTKWRGGGFHLVFMDIQLPVMNGLEATKEIRRLESINGVGFSVGSGNASGNSSVAGGEPSADANPGQVSEGEDRLLYTELFKSPVIIVALTASSLQSDRHEALAAGCNDFLTKPVRFEYIRHKVIEWGCMQALIDFDGWRAWKNFSQGAANLPAPTPSNKSVSTPNKVSSSQPLLTSSPSSLISSASTVVSPTDFSTNVAKDSGIVKVDTAKGKKMNGGMNGGRTGRKEKRTSLGALGSNLSEVIEDGNEDSAGTASTGGKLGIAAGA